MAAAITVRTVVAQDPAYKLTRPLLHRSAAPPCRCSAVPLLRRAAAPPCRCSAVPLLRRAAAPPCRRDTVGQVTSQPRATLLTNAPGRDFRALAGEPTLDFGTLRADLGVTADFPAEVLAQAGRSAATTAAADTPDRTDLPFVTVDPPGARDLDQALHIARQGDGYLVSYAIADVASFVEPGSALDDETRRRGETLYFPDLRVPLHPAVLSEGAASLLPGQIRPAVLWQIALDASGQSTSVDVRRARVRSVAQFDYGATAGHARRGDGAGRGRVARRGRAVAARAGPEPARDQPRSARAGSRRRRSRRLAAAVAGAAAGGELERRDQPAHRHVRGRDDAGGQDRAAAHPARPRREHRVAPGSAGAGARACPGRPARCPGTSWPASTATIPGTRRSSSTPRRCFAVPATPRSTVPLRPTPSTPGSARCTRTSPRPCAGWSTASAREICLAIAAGRPGPDWARSALPTLPAIMAATDHHAHEVDRAVVDTVEAWLLREQIGHVFAAVVVDARADSAHIAVDDPPVRAVLRRSRPAGGRADPGPARPPPTSLPAGPLHRGAGRARRPSDFRLCWSTCRLSAPLRSRSTSKALFVRRGQSMARRRKPAMPTAANTPIEKMTTGTSIHGEMWFTDGTSAARMASLT